MAEEMSSFDPRLVYDNAARLLPVPPCSCSGWESPALSEYLGDCPSLASPSPSFFWHVLASYEQPGMNIDHCNAVPLHRQYTMHLVLGLVSRIR